MNNHSHPSTTRRISSTTKTKDTISKNNNSKEWHVQLYRYTSCDGWQKQTGAATAVSPRKDCIVIPSLRQKFSLISNNGEKTYVIRRDRCILMVSRHRMRALVLQFQTLQDCFDFSDTFMELNNPTTSTTTTTIIDDGGDVMATTTTTAAVPSRHPSPSVSQHQQQQQNVDVARLSDQEEVVSYMAKMLHDKDFLGFVHKIESYLSNTIDGTKILDSLGQQDWDDIMEG